MASWTPDQLRALAHRPKVGQIDIDNMRQALLYAARVIEASDAVLEDNRKLLAEVNALRRTRGVEGGRCEYNGGTCGRGDACAQGCQAMRMVRERRAAADAAERTAGVGGNDGR